MTVVDTDRERDFRAFVEATSLRLHRTAYALTADRLAAEDLVQDVLVRLYVAWPRVDDPLAYSRRALVNASINRWRSRGRGLEVPLTDAHERGVGVDATRQTDDRDVLVRALAVLPPRQRAVLVLRFLEDLSEAAAAAVLGCSTGTIKSQTARALARLRTVLGEDSPTLEQR